MALATEKLESARKYIPNMRVVCDQLVRGGQPDPAGLPHLKEAGITTIVSLCGESSGLLSLFGGSGASRESNESLTERTVAGKLGLEYVSIPLDVFGEPGLEPVEKFLQITKDPERPAVFLHCLHGRDRTGLMTAVFRVVLQGWTAQRAYEEMLECGFDMDRTNLSDVLFQVAKNHQNPRV
jgi:protein tyrosine/serine phosphatase